MTKSISYTKLILSVGMIVFVAALAVAGTGAFFNDTETSSGNTFTAGALDLTVDSVGHINGLVCFNDAWHPESVVDWNAEAEALELNTDADGVAAAVAAYNEEFPSNVPQAGTDCASTWALTDLGPETFFNFSDLKPGDEGENTISLHVNDNDAYACVIIDNMVDADNDCTEPESGADGEACTVEAPEGETGGELSQELRFFAWADDGDNIWEPGDGEITLFSNTEGPASDVIDGVVYPLFTPLTGALPGAETQYVGLYWCYGAISTAGDVLSCDGAPVSNLSQTDSLMADFTFYVEQARNNGDFECPVLREPQLPDPILTLEKQVNQDGVDPVADAAWTLNADGPVLVSGTDNDPSPSPAITGVSVPAGDYTLTELGDVAGFSFQGIECTDGVLVGNVLTLANGDNAVCTFTNVETIQQAVVPN